MTTGTSEIIRKIRTFFGAFGAFSAALQMKNITNRRKIIKNRCGTTDFLQRKGTKMLIHEKVGPRKVTNWARKGGSTKQARKGLSTYLAHLHLRFLYSLCTSAPTVLRSRKGANPARKACLATSVFYTLLINIGSIVPGAPAALGIGAASFDGEGGDVDGKDTAESPTA